MFFPTRENRAWLVVATKLSEAGISLGQVEITVLQGFCPGCGRWGVFKVNVKCDVKNRRIVVYANPGGICARCRCFIDVVGNADVKLVHKALRKLAA